MAEFVLPKPVAGRRFSLLLGTLVLLLMAAPLFGGTARGETELATLFSLLVIGFVVASTRHRLLASAFALIWLAITWSGHGAGIAADLALLALCLVTIDSVLAHALSARQVDQEVIAAAISAYVLMGIAWAVVFSLLEAGSPGAFHLSPEEATEPWSALLYFSFATLTTLGYGDVAPLSLTARAWATVEAMCGTLYLAILIARLVSLYRAGQDTA